MLVAVAHVGVNALTVMRGVPLPEEVAEGDE